MLFNETIKSNIKFGALDAVDKRVLEVVRIGGALVWIGFSCGL